ncbi:unnamed protein product [Didymodactylos carnosus]|uniref:18 kDa Sin3-associated polypeptide n=1 Tax=Didymodactylos carnosus TaxID=1234261 RepID=A0A813NV59_9BILA|nr:unnamed protein product [Didymodactylos carnosus]CAF0745019.1 unnamed protein product [Didymodactylos carnosus]CAF3493825.1 unnamed protein product [Didymodactylos carnosus]CAF3523700.1 unnamed protein product [Didymodactylos carnosus]
MDNVVMSELKLTGEVSKIDKSIDRMHTCPLLLRVFCSNHRHHISSEYEQGNTPENELQIYTWMDATLSELTSLIKEVNPDARRKGTQFSFSIVYPEEHYQRYRIQEIGVTEQGVKRSDDNIPLSAKRFTVGDYLDVAIIHGGGNDRRIHNNNSNNNSRDETNNRDGMGRGSGYRGGRGNRGIMNDRDRDNVGNNSNDRSERQRDRGDERSGVGPMMRQPKDHRDRPY